jgi:hypothetical protein
MTMKWVHLKIRGWLGSATVMVPHGVTVWQFKQLTGLSESSMLTVPSLALPIPDQVVLSNFIRNFDTVYVEVE